MNGSSKTVELPSGWSMVALADIASTSAGGTPHSKTAEYYDGDIPWLKIGDLSDGPVHTSSRNITEQGLASSSAKWLPAGTLLIAMYGSIGKLGILTFPATTNQAICAIQPSDDVSVDYLFWALRGQRTELDALGRGGTQRNISQTDLKRWQIPLAPRNEQDQVVAAIETEFARIEQIDAELNEVDRLASQFRQALLRDAFTGRLFPPRASGAENVVEDRQLAFPDGWDLRPLSDIVENLDRYRVPVNRRERAKREGSIPYYGATGQVGWIDDALFDEPLVLLGEDGVAFLNPSARKAYLIDGPSWVNNHAHVLRPDREVVLDRYLLHALNTISYDGRVSGSTRLKLTQRQMNNLIIPVPPLMVQEEIIDAIDTEFGRIDQAQLMVGQLRQDIRRARTSILHQAFTGQLVTSSDLPRVSATKDRSPGESSFRQAVISSA